MSNFTFLHSQWTGVDTYVVPKKKSGMYSFAGPPMLLCYTCLMRLLMCSNVFTLLCCVLLHPVSNLASVTEQCAYTFKRGRGYNLQWEHRQLVSDLVPGDWREQKASHQSPARPSQGVNTHTTRLGEGPPTSGTPSAGCQSRQRLWKLSQQCE